MESEGEQAVRIWVNKESTHPMCSWVMTDLQIILNDKILFLFVKPISKKLFLVWQMSVIKALSVYLWLGHAWPNIYILKCQLWQYDENDIHFLTT